MEPMNWFKKASGFDFEYFIDIQLRLHFFFPSFFIPMFNPKANMVVLCRPHSHMHVQQLRVLV